MKRMLHNKPALTHNSTPPTNQTEVLSKQRLMGLESIIETLDSPQNKRSARPQSMIVYSDRNGNYDTKMAADTGDSYQKETAALEISAETLAVINEFETMTREFLSRRSSLNYVADT